MINSIGVSVTISGDNNVDFGDKLELICMAEGAGSGSSVGWLLDDLSARVTINTTHITDTKTISVLRISSVASSGDYTCSVTDGNDNGEDTVTVTGESL